MKTELANTIDDFEACFLRPSMYIYPVKYSSLVAFLDGYDYAKSRIIFNAFEDWLHTQYHAPSNLHWGSGVLYILKFGLADPYDALKNPEQELLAIQFLQKVVMKFLQERLLSSSLQ